MYHHYWHHNSVNNNTGTGLAISVLLIILTFVLNAFFQNYNRRIEIKERLCNDSYSICDQLIQIAIQANYDSLFYSYFQILFVKSNIPPKNEEEANINRVLMINKEMYLPLSLKYHDYSHDAIYKFNTTATELSKNMGDYATYVDKDKANKILNLMKKNSLPIIRDYKDDFIATKGLNELDALLTKEYANVLNYVNNNSDGQFIQEVKDIIRPK